MRRLAPLVFLILILLVYLAGNGTVGLWDRDEPRYAQTSRQMLQSGDWVVPRFLDTVRTAKPVFIYWCQASAMRVFGDTAFAARLPSSVAMLITLGIVYAFFRRVAGARRAGWTAFVMASSVMVIASAKMCMTDSVLLLWITISQLCLYAIWSGRREWKYFLLLGGAAGCAGLTKGPVALAINGMTLAPLALFSWIDRITARRAARAEFRFLHDPRLAPSPARGFPMSYEPLAGEGANGGKIVVAIKITCAVLLIIAIATPWMILVERRAPGFLMTSINKDVIERSRQGAEGHSGPPGYYVATVWVTFFPWSLILPAALWTAWKNRRLPVVRFALAATVGPWVMFETVSTKLPHYLLPVFPFLALLTADLLIGAGRGTTTMLRDRTASIFGIGFGVIVAIVGLVPWGLALRFQMRGGATGTISTLAALVALGAGGMTAFHFVRRRPLSAAGAMGVGTLLFVLVVYAAWLPRADFLRLSQRLAADLRAAGATRTDAGYMIDYKEPSLAFHQGGTLREMSDGDYLAHTPPADWPDFLVLPRERWDAEPAAIRAGWTVVATETGLILNGGKMREILVLRNRSALLAEK